MDPYVQLVDELNIDLAYPIVASIVILSIYREVINGVRNKQTTPTTLMKIYKKLLRYISSYNDDTPEEKTWLLKNYMKRLGFGEGKIN